MTYETEINILMSGVQVTPQLSCSSGSLNQIFYYFSLQGSVIDGKFNLIGKPIPANFLIHLLMVSLDAPSTGSCPSTIKYTPKTGSSSGGSGTTTVSTNRCGRP